MLLWLLGLVLWWVFLHVALGGRSDDPPSSLSSPNARRRSSGLRSTHIELGLASLHISTTALNHVPIILLQPFRKRRRRKLSTFIDEDERPLAKLWDVGALFGVVGIVVAQGILAWAALRSVSVLYKALTTDDSPRRLVKRGMEQAISTTSPAAGLLLRPVVSSNAQIAVMAADPFISQIPGLTQPLSALPLIVAALLFAQLFHELGHALAAASYVSAFSTRVLN